MSAGERRSLRARTSVVCLCLLLGSAACMPVPVVRKPATDLPITPRELPRAGYPICDGKTMDMTITGHVWTPEGAPNPGAPIGLHRHLFQPQERLARAGPDGAYSITLTEPAWVEVMGWWHGPPARCAGLPERYSMEVPDGARATVTLAEISFIAWPMCVFPLKINGPGDHTNPLQVWVETPRERVLAERLPGPFDVDLTAPCDSTAVSIIGSGLATLGQGDGSCGASADQVCLDPDAAEIHVELVPSRVLRGRVALEAGAPAAGATVRGSVGRTLTDDLGAFELTLPVSGEQSVEVETDGFLPARFGRDSVPLHGSLDSDGTWRITLRPERRVEVRCAGFEGDRCPVPPTCRGVDQAPHQASTCQQMASFGVVCRCPTTDALVSYPGLDTQLPADSALAWVDWRGHGDTVRTSSEPGCVVLASRETSWRDPWMGPRWNAQAARASADGEVVLEHLTPGRWRLDPVSCDAEPIVIAVTEAEQQLEER